MMHDDFNHGDDAAVQFSFDEYDRFIDAHCMARMFGQGLHRVFKVCSDERAFKTIHAMLDNALYGKSCKSADVVASRLIATAAIYDAYSSSRRKVKNDVQNHPKI